MHLLWGTCVCFGSCELVHWLAICEPPLRFAQLRKAEPRASDPAISGWPEIQGTSTPVDAVIAYYEGPGWRCPEDELCYVSLFTAKRLLSGSCSTISASAPVYFRPDSLREAEELSITEDLPHKAASEQPVHSISPGQGAVATPPFALLKWTSPTGV